MTSEDYRSALAAAIKEYETLGEQRREIDNRLAQLAQTIGTLSRLLGLAPTVPMSITDAVRLAMRAGVPMTPLDVRERLLSIGVDLSAYSNDLAVIHTVLRRLNESGELRLIPQPAGKTAYLWAKPPRAISLGPGDRRVHARPAAGSRVRGHRRRRGTAPGAQGQEEEVMDLALRRRFFAEEIEAVARLRSPTLVDALAAVPREQFLPPGPWTVLAEVDITGMSPAKTRQTPDADPARVYHNIGVAIDPERQLFNGQPATLAPWIDALELAPGAASCTSAAGLGYYTAVMAACVGARGRVLAFEADDGTGGAARGATSRRCHGSKSAPTPSAQPSGETFDAILVNAGVTHPLDSWLDALAPGGRMILPLTAAMAARWATSGRASCSSSARAATTSSAPASPGSSRSTRPSASATRP